MKKAYFLFSVLIVCFMVSGCEQVSSFLGDYFPSMKKEKGRVAVSPTVTKTTPAPTAANTLARAGTWTLTIEEFNQRLEGLKEAFPDYDETDLETKKLILEELVRQQLLVEAAEKQGLGKDRRITEALEEFRKTLLVRELATQLTANISITEQDARNFYIENADLFQEDTQWRIREIVVAEEAKAKELLIGLLQGADFAMVAQMNSIAPTASQGGDTGLVLEFEDSRVQNMVLTLDPGRMSSVFQGEKGYYIIKLEERREGQLQPFEDFKDELIEGLEAMRQEEVLLEYIESLRKQADVFINEQLL